MTVYFFYMLRVEPVVSPVLSKVSYTPIPYKCFKITLSLSGAPFPSASFPRKISRTEPKLLRFLGQPFMAKPDFQPASLPLLLLPVS